jgi:GNAT superfamily N-acetyltransferase
MLKIINANRPGEIELARTLFREYESWLGFDLCFQGFEQELRELPGKYAPPDGRLLLAFGDEQPAGCIAMRKLDKDICEMKRLFVRGGFRGQKIGAALIAQIIDEARAAGYSKMRLDTYPAIMKKAVSLYETHGFRAIAPYYEDPQDGLLFMELEL